MSRRWALVSILLIIGLLGYASFYFIIGGKTIIKADTSIPNKSMSQNSNVVVSTEPPDTVYAIIPENSRRISGSENALVKAILFLDFSNSSSLDILRTFLSLSEERDSDLAVYLYSFPRYKNDLSLPLSTLFIEAISRDNLNRFVEWLFERQSLSKDDVEIFAQDIGIDHSVIFSKAQDKGTTKIAAIADMNIGINFGVNIPPSYFINGVRFDGYRDISEIRRLIDGFKLKSIELMRSGIKREEIYREIVKDGRRTAYNIKFLNQDGPTKKDSSPALYEEYLRYTPYKGTYLAPVTIVLFVDYECPYTKRFFQVIKSAIEKYGKEIRVFVKHYPLSRHKRSIEVAKMLASALSQKKFWVLFEKIMEYPDFPDENTLIKIAVDSGLDVEELKRMRDSKEVELYTLRDMEEGSIFGIKTLPTVYINGVRYEGAMSSARLFKLIEIEREFALKLLKEGVEPKDLYNTLVDRNRIKNVVDMEKLIKRPFLEKIR